MRQLGGKTKNGIPICKEIVELIKHDVNPEPLVNYVEPFCGSMGHFKRIAEFMEKNLIKMHASDGCPDVILLWKQAQSQKFKKPPPVTREMWDLLKAQKEPSALRAYVGYGHAHMGAWFMGFLGDKAHSNPDFLYNDIMKMGRGFGKIKFRHCDFQRAMDKVKGRSIIYCDPPYKDTNWGYGSTFDFDSERLYKVLREWTDAGHTVVVTESNYPYGRVLLEMDQPCNRRAKKPKTFSEKLFLI